MKKGWQTKQLREVLEKTETVNPLLSPRAEFDYIDVSSVSNKTLRAYLLTCPFIVSRTVSKIERISEGYCMDWRSGRWAR